MCTRVKGSARGAKSLIKGAAESVRERDVDALDLVVEHLSLHLQRPRIFTVYSDRPTSSKLVNAEPSPAA